LKKEDCASKIKRKPLNRIKTDNIWTDKDTKRTEEKKKTKLPVRCFYRKKQRFKIGT